jgi:hypothetical protein
MKRVKKVTVKVKDSEMVYYQLNGNAERLSNPVQVLQKVFKDHGELYEKIFGVDREAAFLAGWHPGDCDFSDNCEGWRTFLKDKGKVKKEVIQEEFTMEEFVHNYVGF